MNKRTDKLFALLKMKSGTPAFSISQLQFSFSRLFLFSIVYSLLSVTLSSCKDKKDDTVFDFQYAYAPIDSGHYVIYDVDSMVYNYNQVATIDSAHYQLMEIITDTTYDLNELCYRLERYRRPDQNSPWVIDRVWKVKRNATTFQKDEDDMWFVKLVFPPSSDEEWNGNIYIPASSDPFRDFQDWNYHYQNLGMPFTINGMVFNTTVMVAEINDTSNIITRKVRNEVYALHVGMIYQEWEILKKQDTSNDWQTGPLNGFRIRMKINSHN